MAEESTHQSGRLANVVAPTVELQGRLTPYHVLRTSEVKVDPSECFKIVDWVETDGGGRTKVERWALGKPALMKIAQAAGIKFDPDLTKVVAVEGRKYLMYQAVATMPLPDGTETRTKATTEWFYEEEVQPIVDEVDELRKQLDASTDQQERKRLAGRYHGKKKQLADAMKYRVPMAETKAMNRAIRALLGLKSKYTAEELRAPFVVPRVEYVPDIDNPHVRELLKARAIDTQRALYGTTPDPQQVALPSAAPAEDEPWQLPEQEDYTDEEPSVVDCDYEVVEDDVPPPAQADVWEENGIDEELHATADPARYVIDDRGSTYKGKTLLEVEQLAKEQGRQSYCVFMVKNKKGSDELRDACLAYLEAYDPDGYAMVVTR